MYITCIYLYTLWGEFPWVCGKYIEPTFIELLLNNLQGWGGTCSHIPEMPTVDPRNQYTSG